MIQVLLKDVLTNGVFSINTLSAIKICQTSIFLCHQREVCVVVLNKCSIFVHHTVRSIRMGDIVIDQFLSLRQSVKLRSFNLI